MYYHSLRLIDDQEIIVLINDIKGDILWSRISIDRSGDIYGYIITLSELIAVLGNDLTVNGNITCRDKAREIRSRILTVRCLEDGYIQPLTCLRCLKFHLPPLP